MEYLLWALGIMVVSGLAAWAMRAQPSLSGPVGAGGGMAACCLGLWGSGQCLLFRQLESQNIQWSVPFGSMSMRLDLLAALFLTPIFLVGAMTALAAVRRLPGSYAANRPGEHWLFHNLTLAAAAGAVLARNAVFFLFAWELMTVASFLLIENEQREPGARRGGWVYLTAGHIGGACLFAMFALMGGGSGRLDFLSFSVHGWTVTAVFILAVVGFGGKIGLFPFHAWYPESYPAAPPHVGALLSGVVGNLGIYGLMRILYLLGQGGPPPAWWGLLLLGCGLASAVIGAARSLVSRDLSRLLAWSSVENYGLMACGVGLGLIGAARADGIVSFLGFAAALFHMLNHSVSKALLFLCAGDVYNRAGTRDPGRMGGLLKRLPLTGMLFLIGALGAAAIPPANGFASELLLLLSAFTGVVEMNSTADLAVMVAALAGIGLVGGIAAAAYAKAFGFVFLGNPRGPGGIAAVSERRAYLAPHLILAGLAIFLAAASPQVLEIVRPAAEVLTRAWLPTDPDGNPVARLVATAAGNPLRSAHTAFWLVAGTAAAAALARWLLVRRKRVRQAPTWDCGFAVPDARAQYTPSSFVQPLGKTLSIFANQLEQKTPVEGVFPARGEFSASVPGVERAWGYSQLFNLIGKVAGWIRVTQAGRVQIYLLYMAAVLIALLLWKL
ncbi:MAG: hypothetical protein LIP23_08745 [Planctomycetes bacterium]|nr:hypothetical protein [Planctomycetota bacterium]